ncbi:MAG TPA: hypothetical protein VLS44_04215 [Nitrospira sp.]|nr:hypothetical protein [Nitrospira sp.]
MNGIQFEEQSPVVAVDPNRADIACFVGFVARREGSAIPQFVRDWMGEYGWTAALLGRPGFDTEALDDVPVPIDSWELFDRLFRWERRTGESSGVAYLGAAVRSFFAQGGRKCYVVRVGDPWERGRARPSRLARVDDLIPGWAAGQVTCTPLARTSWSGVGHLFGLPEVSYLCLPDLAEAFAVDPEPATGPELPLLPEQFVECGAEPADPVAGDLVRWATAPRCDEAAAREWATAVNLLGGMIARWQREVQLVLALPLPKAGTQIERDCHGWLSDQANGILDAGLVESNRPGVASAFVQLAFPWVQTSGSNALPERLESPDGVLAGVLARNALMRGSFHSAAGLPLVEVSGVSPAWGAEHFERPAGRAGERGTRRRSMVERVSLLGQAPRGFILLSDVTTSIDEGYRPACANRLVTAIVRAARRAGEDLVFESSGEALWGRIRESLQRLLVGLFQDGALRGATPAEAFQVRCDRSTMSQNDLDAGRVIVSVQFQAALPIERITVVLGLHEGGQVSVLSSDNGEAARP